MNILFASHTYIGGPFVVGSHHLARELSKMGHRVFHLSTSVTPAHLLKMKQRPILDRFRQWWNLRKMNGGLIHGVPLSLVPWNVAGRIFQKTGSNWFVESIRFPKVSKLLKRHRFTEVDLLLIDQPYFVGIEKHVKAKIVIYRPTDHYAEMSGDFTVAAAEREIAGKAHGMIATSEPVLLSVRQYNEDVPAIVLENGVEFEHFSQGGPEPEELREIPRPRAIYVGAVDERLDLKALRILAERRPDVSLIVIGPHSATAAVSFAGLANVFFLGQKPYAELPSYLHHADLALLPLSDHKANRGRSPMKLYEYAAAGLPIVVRETPELLRRGERFLAFYNGSEDLVRAVGEVLDRSSRHAISKDEIRGAARRQSWKSKAESIVDFSRRLREAAETKKNMGAGVVKS
uniref:Glycosyltransferase n=2 Tax=Cohnella candidum TaxID=2674991 RepID=A0A3G3K5E1_9BACL|nr:glycosyltransferase [Cohnella candidum]